MKGFELSPAAKRDLDEIVDYIATDSIDQALEVLRVIESKIMGLVKFPEMGSKRPDLVPGQDLRFWPVYSYLIVYRPHSKPLEVVRVISGYRDLEELLGED
ncbi:MAG: type II toxin-antitoxin system RelE/ParE family toxin [Planctomycetota bacterium]